MRCYVEPDVWDLDPISLDPDESHYLLDVRRVRPGETVELFDGAGHLAEARIEAVERGRILVRARSRRSVPRPRPAFTLLQALPKAQKMDLIVQKCTELGVARIAPVSTDRAVVKMDRSRASRKVSRWRTVARNAIRQCGGAWAPAVDPVRPLADTLAGLPPHTMVLLCDLEPAARPIRDVLEPLRRAPPADIAVAVGPEGDFSDAERKAFAHAAVCSIHLGPTVLRTETAAIYAVGALRYAFG